LTTYVRLHLEYCAWAWNPWNIVDKEVLEAVQRRTVSNLKDKTYERRLKELGLDTLEERRK
jgi:hypothetical protein